MDESLLERNPSPSEDTVWQALSSNIRGVGSKTLFIAWNILLLASLWSSSLRATGQAAAPPNGVQEPVHAIGGISDYAKVHKYFIAPEQAVIAEMAKKESGLDPRKEFTYTVTAVLRIAKPFNIADMSDDYQDARIISEDKDSATIEVIYYPLNTNKDAISENSNWKRDYAGMTEYLRPTVTENWDEKMRADLIAGLKTDGIDPDKLTDKQLVIQVSHWLMKRSRSTRPFATWLVYYPEGRPEVFPTLRSAFDREKPSPDWTDQAMFEQEVLGRSMFYNRTHGSCTPSAVLIATVMRALGIPTRILFFVPVADGNDRAQREMVLSNIHDNAVRSEIRHGLPSGGFANHLYNEVFVGNRWVRLNYDVLGQNILDASYMGLMTHILTTDSLSHVPIAETWGSRLKKYPDVPPKLSSINPYQLLSVSDHFGIYSQIANPEVDSEELRKVTVIDAFWKGALPPAIAEHAAKDPVKSDFYIGIQEFIPHYSSQMPDFEARAGNHFVLVAADHPDIKVKLSGMKISLIDGPRRYSLFGLLVDQESIALLAPGVKYAIHPINTNDTYVWTVKDGVFLESGR